MINKPKQSQTMQFFDPLLSKNIDKIYPSKEAFIKRLETKKPIRIYLGIDASSPKLHIGHSIVLKKLAQFQKLGHKVILLVGDFTGMIGDPTDKNAMRKQLTFEEVKENAKTYQKQAEKILDFEGNNKAEFAFNSNWLSKMDLKEILNLTSKFTVQQMLERDMFQQRLKENKPIGIHEFLYPLMQGFDSVALDVEAEIGGTDQTFNMLVGRDLVEEITNKEKFVLTVPLIEGLDGRKMSKSYENTVDLDDTPVDMYGKIMSVDDNLILKYFEVFTDVSETEIKDLRTKLETENPIQLKKKLARTIAGMYFNDSEVKNAENEFESVVQKQELPTVIEEVEFKRSLLPKPYSYFLTETGLVESNSEAQRLAQQGAVFFDGVKISNVRELFETGKLKVVVKAGKRKYRTLVFI